MIVCCVRRAAGKQAMVFICSVASRRVRSKGCGMDTAVKRWFRGCLWPCKTAVDVQFAGNPWSHSAKQGFRYFPRAASDGRARWYLGENLMMLGVSLALRREGRICSNTACGTPKRSCPKVGHAHGSPCLCRVCWHDEWLRGIGWCQMLPRPASVHKKLHVQPSVLHCTLAPHYAGPSMQLHCDARASFSLGALQQATAWNRHPGGRRFRHNQPLQRLGDRERPPQLRL